MAEVKLSSTRFSMLFKRSRYYFLFCILITLILFSCNDQGVETVPPTKPPSAKFTIATSAGLGGEITDSQSNVESGQSVKITATAQEHYQLKQWTGNCGSFSKDDLEITITASNNCQVRAEFEKIIYSITAISKGGGSLSDGQLSREQGQTAAFTAESQEGYQFSEWKVGEDSDCPTLEDTSNPKVTFVVVGNCSLEAVFVKAPRTITTIADEGGFLTSNGEIIETLTVDHGDEVEIIATNEDHYELKNWESSCGDFGDGQLTIMFIAEKDCTIKAVFEKVNYTITVSSTDGGSVSDEGELSIMYGQTAILTVNHEEGYEFSGWETSECTTLEDTSSPKAEFIVRGDCSLEAVFTKEARKITIEENQNGKITITPSTTVDHGDEVEITATPNQYYEFEGWVGTCGDLNNDESTITIIVVADCTIEAVFESTRYTITASSSDGGSVNQEGELSKEHGQTVSFIATPEDGYTFSKWTLAEDASCPSQIDVSNINLEFNVSGDCQLQAVFERSEYTISASSTEGGIVDEPELKREYGQTVTLKAKANEGYDFSGWTLVEETECPKIDNESNPTLEFVVVGDCQLQANFTLVPRTITTSADEGGKITATRIVKDGEKVTIEVTVEKHYEFGGWEGTCGEFSLEEKSINFTVSKDCDIKALIKPRNYTITTKGSGGKLTPETIEAEYNKAITIEANPDPGYEFSKWESIGSDCPELTDPIYSIFKFQVKGDCELEAVFDPIEGYVPPPEEEPIQENEQTTPNQPTTTTSTNQPTPSNQPTTTTTTNQPTTSTQPTTTTTTNQPVKTNTEKNNDVDLTNVKYTLTTIAGIGGLVWGATGSRDYPIWHNQESTLTANPKGPYKFSKWETNCGDFSDDELTTNPLKIKGSKDCCVKAIFSPLSINPILAEDVITNFGTSFDDDPIYSQITFRNPESYLNAFIRDARRHGYEGNLNINTSGYDIPEDPTVNFAIADNCSNPPSIRVSREFWNILSRFPSKPNIRPDIHVIWHELGHAILNLNHLNNNRDHIMYPTLELDPQSSNHLNFEEGNNRWREAVGDFFSLTDQDKVFCNIYDPIDEKEPTCY